MLKNRNISKNGIKKKGREGFQTCPLEKISFLTCPCLFLPFFFFKKKKAMKKDEKGWREIIVFLTKIIFETKKT